MKKFLVLITITAIAVAGWYTFYKDSKNKFVAPPKTTTVERKDLDMIISASGVVEPNFLVEVKSKASGKILVFSFEPGDVVKTGERLLTLDRSTELRAKAQSEADLARAMAELQSVKAARMLQNSKLTRARALNAKKLLSAEEMEEAKATAIQAEANVGKAQAAVRKAELFVDEAKERLADTEILSPIDGVLIEKFVERGQIISSGITSLAGGSPLCSVADLSRIFIMASVDETDIGKVMAGQKVKVTVDAYPDKVFGGAVTRVYPMGESKDNITIFKVKVEATGENRSFLKPKMTANVDMIVESKTDVIVIPDEAIKAGRGEKGDYVYVMENETATKRDVTIGISNGFETEITDGLAKGEKVLLRYQDKKR